MNFSELKMISKLYAVSSLCYRRHYWEGWGQRLFSQS